MSDNTITQNTGNISNNSNNSNNDLFYKEKLMGYIIGINPTGTISFDGTYNLKGKNDIIQTSSEKAKDNLQSVQNNTFICKKKKVIESFVSKNPVSDSYLDYLGSQFNKKTEIVNEFVTNYEKHEFCEKNKFFLFVIILFFMYLFILFSKK